MKHPTHTQRDLAARLTLGRRGRECGYLLLEIVIAFGILAVGIFALLNVQQAQIETGRSMARYETALDAANALLERFRAHGLPAGDADGKTVPLGLPAGTTLVDATCRLWIADLSADTPGLKRVRVVVSWRGRKRRVKRAELETLMIGGQADAP